MTNINTGFSPKQKQELGQILTDKFVELFKEIVLPGLDDISERLSRVEARLTSLESRVKILENKVEELKVEVAHLNHRVRDLEMNTVEMRSYLDLKSRVSTLERRVGIVTA